MPTKTNEFYYTYTPNSNGELEQIDIIASSDLKNWLQTEGVNYNKLKFVNNNGRFVELIRFSETDWDVVNRGIEDLELHERTSFKRFAKRREAFQSSAKKADKDKSLDQRKHYMKASRGIDRKRQSYVPAYKQLEHQTELPTAQNILTTAKKATSGAWRLSKRQVEEIAGKYKFYIPSGKKRTKHLGSTGIIMWRKDPKTYYLIKFSKHHHLSRKKK